MIPYLIFLFEVGYHDNGWRIKLPYHPPEVRETGRNGTLGGNVPVGVLVSLQQMDEMCVKVRNMCSFRCLTLIKEALM